jgi:hypothetical protein
MAKAKRELTITWLKWQAALDLVAAKFSSKAFVEQWLVEQLAADRIRWRTEAVRPPDESLDGFWRRHPSINSVDNSATGLVVAPAELGVVGTYYVTVYGIHVVQEDIVRALEPEKLEPEDWLIKAYADHPRRPGRRGHSGLNGCITRCCRPR